jgi:hypothetical protein
MLFLVCFSVEKATMSTETKKEEKKDEKKKPEKKKTRAELEEEWM